MAIAAICVAVTLGAMANTRAPLALALIAACGSGATTPDGDVDAPIATDDAGDASDPGHDAAGGFALPPVNAGLDYQLGGAYTPPAGVAVLRDPPVSAA